PKVETVKKEKVAPKVAKAEPEVDYNSMLVKDLKTLATEKGIDGANKMLKADLVDALKKTN
ncbi:MAG: Rho termination factor N-terminal domain-containing protein, partial [Acholeplasmataceae bacterium]|nr:Rho termination factor N-terminal domain-containing protein [Acholeplasmataceae bacterium]